MAQLTHKQLMNKYHVQKTYAKNRGIGWHFTFEEWVAWWGEDIDKRGNTKDSLVMARTGDIGPYHPDNVRKATLSENTQERNSRYITHSLETKELLSKQSKGLYKIKTPDGIFNNWTEAAKHYGVTRSHIASKRRRYPDQYYFIEEK
jgi:hypothetical protein